MRNKARKSHEEVTEEPCRKSYVLRLQTRHYRLVYDEVGEAVDRLIKAVMRLAGDGSGYEYHSWFDAEGLVQRLDSIWWVYDFEADEEKDEEVRRILSWFREALGQK